MTYGGALVSADNAWGNYHWARTTSPFSLTVVNSTTSDWDGYVTVAVDDWSYSLLKPVDVPRVLIMDEDPDGSTATRIRRRCKAPSGKVRICNLAYGNNGWLGLAGISIDAAGHIVSGYTKLNDTYFSSTFYNTPGWKQSVVCQELGHNVGLDHQDVDFYNESLGSCMDYQVLPNPWANAHDFDQLASIYEHLDSYDSYAATAEDGESDGSGCNAPPGKGCNKAGVGQGNSKSEWGMSLGRRGAHETFIRIDPDGTRHLTFVTWVDAR